MLPTLQDVIRPTVTGDELKKSSVNARFEQDRNLWLQSAVTIDLFEKLVEAQLELDAAAKNFAELDEQPNAAVIRALLLKSKTIERVLDYAKRRNRDDKFNG